MRSILILLLLLITACGGGSEEEGAGKECTEAERLINPDERNCV